LVIRAGKDGSYTFSRGQRIWLPAYHQPGTSGATAVVDPTGAGNSFLGALAQGLISSERDPGLVITSVLAECGNWQTITKASAKHRDMLVALICATVAAG